MVSGMQASTVFAQHRLCNSSGWILKFGEDSTRLCTSVETFVDWLANGSLPWAAYIVFMSVWLIVIDKNPSVRPVGVGETWKCLFSNTVLKVTGMEEIIVCQDGHLCAGLKEGIDSAIHGVQSLWEKILST